MLSERKKYILKFQTKNLKFKFSLIYENLQKNRLIRQNVI